MTQLDGGDYIQIRLDNEAMTKQFRNNGSDQRLIEND